jgi:hypothetical protein
MTTATKQYTQTEIRDNFNAAQKRLLPAILNNSQEDIAFTERLVTQFILSHQLEPTAENFYRSFKENVKVLPWLVKPAALVAQEQNEKPRNQNEALKDITTFTAKVRAGEAADAQAKSDAATIKNIELTIGSYMPIDKRGRVAFGKQSTVQSQLREYVKAELARKVSPTAIFEKVTEHIAKLYREDELANERV